MKTTYLIFACMFTFVYTSIAQVTPTPPNNSTGNRHTDVTTTISNSTSISNSDRSYKFTSKFERSKRIKIQQLLSERLKNYGLKISGQNYVWSEERNGSLIFECKLTNRKMKMFLYKKGASKAVHKKIKALGAELQKLITKHTNSNYKQNNIHDARENVRRAARALERAKERLRIVERENN